MSERTNPEESMSQKKPKRDPVVRIIEALVGAFLAYISLSAADLLEIIFLFLGFFLVLHALVWD